MARNVTFTFKSTKYQGTEATETFTFKQLEIDEDINDAALKKEIDKKFQAWVWNKFNISYSIVIGEEDDLIL